MLQPYQRAIQKGLRHLQLLALPFFFLVFSAVNAKIIAYPSDVEVVFAGISTIPAVDPVTMIVVMRPPSTITISMVVYPMKWKATCVPG